MKLAWLTDIHLNFLHADEVEAFIQHVAETPCDGILLTGDIGESPDVLLFLNRLDIALQRPIYFVLGNHDFYRGSIVGVRAKVDELCKACPNLKWMNRETVNPLTDKTCIVGHDGWGDGRYGNYWSLEVLLNDWALIQEFRGLDDQKRLAKLHELGDEAGGHLRKTLPEALDRFEQVIVATHVPPFRESCWHQGQISNDEWLPHFSCKAVGDVLVDAMQRSPDRQMTVYCGHTHSSGVALLLPNLKVYTGGAEYGNPIVQQIVEVS